MKNIKTYEGFFDFLKKKEKVKVTPNDVIECLFDLTDEYRVKNQLNFDRGLGGIFADEDVVFKKKPSMSSMLKDPLTRDERFRENYARILLLEKNFKVRGNDIAFNITYKPDEISDTEVNDLLLDCKSKLEMYDCDIKFFIGWGRDEGSSSDKEWSDFMRMVNYCGTSKTKNITIKITSPSGFTTSDFNESSKTYESMDGQECLKTLNTMALELTDENFIVEVSSEVFVSNEFSTSGAHQQGGVDKYIKVNIHKKSEPSPLGMYGAPRFDYNKIKDTLLSMVSYMEEEGHSISIEVSDKYIHSLIPVELQGEELYLKNMRYYSHMVNYPIGQLVIKFKE